MALLTIQEPQVCQTRDKLSIGIDLGTTYSLVAVWQDGQPIVLPDDQGDVLLPSVVALRQGEYLVGQEAMAHPDKDCVFSSFKRLMGKEKQALCALKQQVTDTILCDRDNTLCFQSLSGPVQPIDLSAQILLTLKQRAENYLKQPVHQAVITVPAYFDEISRQATKLAAEKAGLRVLRLLNEPTAAALAYGQAQLSQGIYAVYDLGGGTFDISIVSLEKGVYRVLATAGDTALGGDDFDLALMHFIIKKTGIKPDTVAQTKHLKIVAKKTKERLSKESSVSVDHKDSTHHWQTVISRDEFEQVIQPLMQKTLGVCQQALIDAHQTTDTLDQVILVGGATRVPFVQQQVRAFFQQDPKQSLDPDQVVAMGAARQAYVLAGNALDGDLLLDVLPLSVGLEMMGGVSEKIIARNTPLPSQITQRYTTYADNQTGMQFHVLQGERELAKDCRSLAHFELKNLPMKPAGMVEVEVIFQIDADGLLCVKAKELHTGNQVQVEVNARYGLNQQTVNAMLEDAITHAETDVLVKKFTQKQVEAQKLLATLNQALKDAGELLAEWDLQALQQAMLSVNQQLYTDLRSLNQALKACEQLAEPFLLKRFNTQLTISLQSRTVEQWEEKGTCNA
jgi:molecular chaperone HscA